MSHNTVIEKVKITDLSALESAIKEMQAEGISVRLNRGPNATFRSFMGRKHECDAAIEFPNYAYDIGLVKGKDGAYTPKLEAMFRVPGVSCPWSATARDERDQIGLLLQKYSVCVVENDARMRGNSVRRQKGNNGKVQLIVEYA